VHIVVKHFFRFLVAREIPTLPKEVVRERPDALRHAGGRAIFAEDEGRGP
jgi:hypothetical protein